MVGDLRGGICRCSRRCRVSPLPTKILVGQYQQVVVVEQVVVGLVLLVGVSEPHGVGSGQLVEYGVSFENLVDIGIERSEAVLVGGEAHHVAEFGHGTGVQQFAVQDTNYV